MTLPVQYPFRISGWPLFWDIFPTHEHCVGRCTRCCSWWAHINFAENRHAWQDMPKINMCHKDHRLPYIFIFLSLLIPSPYSCLQMFIIVCFYIPFPSDYNPYSMSLFPECYIACPCSFPWPQPLFPLWSYLYFSPLFHLQTSPCTYKPLFYIQTILKYIRHPPVT